MWWGGGGGGAWGEEGAPLNLVLGCATDSLGT